MATVRMAEGATAGSQGVSTAGTAAEQTHARSVEPRDLSKTPAAAASVPCEQPQQQQQEFQLQQKVQEQQQQQQQQRQHPRRTESVIRKVAWPDQTLEERREDFISRQQRSKAYGAYLLHQADLRRQRDLLEKLTRHDYSAGFPVSSTHEAFAAPSITDAASVAAAAEAASRARWLKKIVLPHLCADGDHRSPAFAAAQTEAGAGSALAAPFLLRQHRRHGADASSLAQQIHVQQQLLYQQQQCLLQQQQQQELLRKQQEQQKLLQQQQQLLQQQQQRFLESQQPLKLKETPACESDPKVTCVSFQPAAPQHSDGSNSYQPEVSATHHTPAKVFLPCAQLPFGYPPNETTTGRIGYADADAAPAIDSVSLSPIRRADFSGATYSAARRAACTDADAYLPLPTEDNTCFPKALPGYPLYPSLLPRLRRAPQPRSRLATAAAMEVHQQQEQLLRRISEERRAYGEFLKHQIARRKAAEKAEKTLEKELYGVGGVAGVAAGSLGGACAGAREKFGSNSHETYLNENLQIYSHAPSHPHHPTPAGPARCAVETLVTKEGSKEQDFGAARERIANGEKSNEGGSCSNQPKSSVSFNTREEVSDLNVVEPTRSNGGRRRYSVSGYPCSAGSPTRKKNSTERSSGTEDDIKSTIAEDVDAAAAIASKKRKQQEYRDFLLMQMEQKRGNRVAAGRKGTPPEEDHAGPPKHERNSPAERSTAEIRFRSKSCCSEPSVYLVDFEEATCSDAATTSCSSAAAAATEGEAAEKVAIARPEAVDTERKDSRTDFSLRSRCSRRGEKTRLPSHSGRSSGDAKELLQLGRAPEEQQRLMREQERRKAYQAALLQQIREREEARQRQRQEKLREQEKERQLSYEALERERRNMRTGRKNVNNLAFTNKDTNSDELATTATTAAAELDSPCNLAAAAAERLAATEECSGKPRVRMNVCALDKGMHQAFSAPSAVAAATKQSTPRNPSAATAAAAILPRSGSSAVLASSPAASKPQKQQAQQQEAPCRTNAGTVGSLLSTAVASLHGEEKTPELLGNLASCLQTVHLEIQRQQEELRSVKLQQQLSALQHRVQQDEVTRILSALTHQNNLSTSQAAEAAGSVPAGTTAARAATGSSCCLQNQHPLVMQSSNCPDCLSVSRKAELRDSSDTVAKSVAPSFLHGSCFAKDRGTAAEEGVVAALASGVAPVVQAGDGAINGDALSLEHDSGLRPVDSAPAYSAGPLFPDQHHGHHHVLPSHADQHHLLHHEAHNRQQRSNNNTKGLHSLERDMDMAEERNAELAAPTCRHDNGAERRIGADASSTSPGRAAAEVNKDVRVVSFPRRQRSSRVNEIIDSFTHWLKPAALQKKEVQDLLPRRSSSFYSASSSDVSVLQLPAAERNSPVAYPVAFPQSMLHQQPQEQQQQQLSTQKKCNDCSAFGCSCACSSSSSPHILQMQHDPRRSFGTAATIGMHSSQLPPSPLFLPVSKEPVSSNPQCCSNWRGYCVSPLAAQNGSCLQAGSLPQECHFTQAGASIGTGGSLFNGTRRKYCATGSAAETAPPVAATRGPDICCGAASAASLSFCSYAFKDNVASGCCLHLPNTCSAAAANKQASPTACHYHTDSRPACNQLQQCTHACCCGCLDATGGAVLHCPRREHALQVSCTSHEQQQVLQLPQYLEQQQPREVWIERDPEQEHRFVEICDSEPLEAPSYAWSVEETAQQPRTTEQQVPDFMRFSTETRTALGRSLSLAPPANKLMLRRWLGGILPPPPSKDLPEQQQQEQKAENDEDQEKRGKDERRLLWRGGRNKTQHRGPVARTRSAAAAAAASDKGRRVTSTAAGSSSSDKVGDIKGRSKPSLRVSTVATTTPAAPRGTASAGVGVAAAEVGIERPGGSSSVKGFLGLLGHVWDRRRRVEDDRVMNGEGRGAPDLRIYDRMKMRLSWDAEQPWDSLLHQGATNGSSLLCATAAELQRCLEKQEQEKQRRERLQQLKLQQLRQEPKGEEVCSAPKVEDGEGTNNGKKQLLAAGVGEKESAPAAQQKERRKEKKGGWRLPIRSTTESRKAVMPQERPGDESRQQQQQQEEPKGSDGSDHGVETDAEGGTRISASSGASKQQTQRGGMKNPAPPQTETSASLFTSAPPTPAVPPEPHRKPKNLKR